MNMSSPRTERVQLVCDDISAKNSLRVERLRATHAHSDGLTIVFCSGFNSSMMGIKATRLLEHCASIGAGFVRFDYRGHGESTGDFSAFGIDHWLADTLQIVDAIPAPVILVGSSMGAWLATLATLRRRNKIKALVTLAAAPDFTDRLLWASLSKKQQQSVQAGKIVSIRSPYDKEPWRLANHLFESGRKHLLLNENRPVVAGEDARVRCPMRLLHGSNDMDVPPAFSKELLAAVGGQDASYKVLTGGDHRLSDDESLKTLTAVVDSLVLRVKS